MVSARSLNGGKRDKLQYITIVTDYKDLRKNPKTLQEPRQKAERLSVFQYRDFHPLTIMNICCGGSKFRS